MTRFLAIMLSTAAVFSLVTAAPNGSLNQFPDGFLLGAATSAYQIEGAWNEDGKGESIWDRMLHEHPEYTNNGATGDVACDSYHKYAEDVEALKGIGATAYRFSISWPRILPTGDLDVINQAGIDYYNNLINLLLENGIEPLVTMYHWDLPQALQYIGGWPNPLIADYFVEYGRILFQNFGDRVKWWITFNEPVAVTTGYSSAGWLAPSLSSPGIGNYLAAHTLIRAHGKVYRLYDQEFRATQNVGALRSPNICGRRLPSRGPSEGGQQQRGRGSAQVSPAQLHRRGEAVHQRFSGFLWAELLHDETSHAWSNMPGVTGSSPSLERDSGIVSFFNESWPVSSLEWLRVVPWGFRKLLNWVATEYAGYPIIVTENGYADRGELDDQARISYYGGEVRCLPRGLQQYRPNENPQGISEFPWRHLQKQDRA